MCLHTISHATAARQRYTAPEHQLRSTGTARADGRDDIRTRAELLPQPRASRRQADLPAGRSRVSQPDNLLCSAACRQAWDHVLLPCAGWREYPVPGQVGCPCAGRGLHAIRVSEAAHVVSCDRHWIQQRPCSRLITPRSPSAGEGLTEHTTTALPNRTRAAPAQSGTHQAGQSRFPKPLKSQG